MPALKPTLKVPTETHLTVNNLKDLMQAHVLGEIEVHAPGSSGKFLHSIGLVDDNGGITTKGQAHIAQLQKLELPRQEVVWVDGQGKVIPF